jgi:hypothetical protein
MPKVLMKNSTQLDVCRLSGAFLLFVTLWELLHVSDNRNRTSLFEEPTFRSRSIFRILLFICLILSIIMEELYINFFWPGLLTDIGKK